MLIKAHASEALYNSLKYINRLVNEQQRRALQYPTRMLMNLTRRTCKEIKYLNFLHNQAENLSEIIFCALLYVSSNPRAIEKWLVSWKSKFIKPNQPLKNTPAVKLLKCDYILYNNILPSIHHHENHELEKNYSMSIRATELTTKCSTSNSFCIHIRVG
jgi:hypothetical protein